MIDTHLFFIRRMCTLLDVHDLVDAGRPHAVVAFGQPTESFEFGYTLSAANCESLLEAVCALTMWSASPEWVMSNAPGFVGPIRCAIALHHHNDQQVEVVCTIGRSTSLSVVTRTHPDPELTMPLIETAALRYQQSTPVLLQQMMSMQEDDFEDALDDIFSFVAPQDFGA